jgi:putative transposase
MIKKFKPHHPFHIYRDDAIYFITASTLNKIRYFNTEQKKDIFQKTLQETVKKFQFSPYGWIVLDNHYHLLLKVRLGKDLPKFIKQLHSQTSSLLNRIDNKKSRQVWYQYWDRCIRNEADFWRHLNYLHHNCRKHGYADKLSNYKWSSFNLYLKKYSEEWIARLLWRYPIKYLPIEEDAF